MVNKNYTILLVDDEPLNLRVLANVLSPLYQLKVANSGNRAMEILENGANPDLILLDIMMPGKNGFEICKWIKSTPTIRNIPIIFVTTVNDSESEETGLRLGAIDYITKPLVPEVVKARVATHLSLHHQQMELEQQVSLRTKELSDSRLEIIHQLGRAAEYRDNDTGMHVIRMANFARKIAEYMGADNTWIETLYWAAPLHDVGKIGIPDGILLKPGKLNNEEWEIMKTHSEIGAQIIGANHGHDNQLFSMAHAIALNHHEYWDGSGYPSGISGDQIPLAARIVACADVFDALTSERPYKKPWPIDEAIQHINNLSGKQFDPEIVEIFNAVVGEFPSIIAQYRD